MKETDAESERSRHFQLFSVVGIHVSAIQSCWEVTVQNFFRDFYFTLGKQLDQFVDCVFYSENLS